MKQAKAQEELSKTKEELDAARAAEVLLGLLSMHFYAVSWASEWLDRCLPVGLAAKHLVRASLKHVSPGCSRRLDESERRARLRDRFGGAGSALCA